MADVVDAAFSIHQKLLLIHKPVNIKPLVSQGDALKDIHENMHDQLAVINNRLSQIIIDYKLKGD